MLEYLTLENDDQRTRWMDVEVVKIKISSCPLVWKRKVPWYLVILGTLSRSQSRKIKPASLDYTKSNLFRYCCRTYMYLAYR
jgi:hypothetical protein